MPPARRNLLVGGVVLIAMLALAWMILKFADTSAAMLFTHGTRFQLVADRVDGLSEGSPVLYLGVNVGRVMRLDRQPNNLGVVVYAILDPGPPVPANVVGVIRQQSALGAAAGISLESATPGIPPADGHIVEGTRVPAHYSGGGIVPPEFTGLAADLREQQVIRHLDQTIVTMRVQLERAGELLDSTRALVGDPKLRDDIKATVASVRQAADNLSRFTGKLDQISDDATATLKQVRATVADGGQHMNDVSKQVGDRMQQLAEVLDKVQSITNKIDKGQGTAGALVNDPHLYESLTDAARELNVTVKGMQRLVEQWEEDGVSLKLK